MEKTDVLAAVCKALSQDAKDSAVTILKEHYPFAPEEISKRRYGAVDSTRVFVRDGFIDRYSGKRLIFPPVLRVLSAVLPTDRRRDNRDAGARKRSPCDLRIRQSAPSGLHLVIPTKWD